MLRTYGRWLILASLCGPCAIAQQHEQFSTRGDRLPDGSTPHVVFDLSKTQPNWAGTDGAGCCVMASNRNNAIYLGMEDVGETLKRVSQSRPGGHWHEKFLEQMKLVEAEHPGIQYWSNPSADWSVLREYNRRGLPIGITMGTGARYRYQIIGHMVSAVHIGEDNELSAYCDNNFPRELSAMPTPIFQRRAAIGNPTGKPWATILFPRRRPLSPLRRWQDEAAFALICIAIAGWSWTIAQRLTSQRMLR